MTGLILPGLDAHRRRVAHEYTVTYNDAVRSNRRRPDLALWASNSFSRAKELGFSGNVKEWRRAIQQERARVNDPRVYAVEKR